VSLALIGKLLGNCQNFVFFTDGCRGANQLFKVLEFESGDLITLFLIILSLEFLK